MQKNAKNGTFFLKRTDAQPWFRQVVKNMTFPPAKFETFTNKKIPCYLAESVNSLPTYPYYIE